MFESNAAMIPVVSNIVWPHYYLLNLDMKCMLELVEIVAIGQAYYNIASNF